MGLLNAYQLLEWKRVYMQSSTLSSCIYILKRLDQEKAYLNLLLNNLIKQKRITSRDKALVTKVIKGVLEERDKINYKLNQFLKRKKMAELPDTIRYILQLTFYNIVYLDRLDKRQLIHAAVDLCKEREALRHFVPIVYAVLNKLFDLQETLRHEEIVLPDDPLRSLSLNFSYPLWLIEAWSKEFSFDEIRAFCEANRETYLPCLRVNTVNCTKEALVRCLFKEGIETVEGKWYKHSLYIQNQIQEKILTNLKAIQRGLGMLHDESSSLIASLLDPKPHETIVDLCAAPGGKTVHLGAMMKEQSGSSSIKTENGSFKASRKGITSGRIIALDKTEKRIALIRKKAHLAGIANIECIVGDCTKVTLSALNVASLNLAGGADKVLADVPCSGTGVIYRRPDIKYNKKQSDFEALSLLQRALLNNAASLTKVGGLLLYSTCSINRSENEEIVFQFLNQKAEYAIQDISTLVPETFITEDGFFRSLPHRHGIGGAFGALLKRVC
jgi:16S rRNA (cytosine967-C5)-methyltransferase